MNNNPTKDDGSSSDIPPSTPQTTPKGIGYGHPEYQFVQSIMEMQKSLGEINASIRALEKSVEITNSKVEVIGEVNSSIKALNQTVDSTKSKVDDLVKWKHMIIGGAIVSGVVISVIFAVGTKIMDHISFNPTPHNQTEKISEK